MRSSPSACIAATAAVNGVVIATPGLIEWMRSKTVCSPIAMVPEVQE